MTFSDTLMTSSDFLMSLSDFLMSFSDTFLFRRSHFLNTLIQKKSLSEYDYIMIMVIKDPFKYHTQRNGAF